MITPYSVLATVLWSSAFFLLFLFCRRSDRVLLRIGAAPLLVLAAGGVLRFLLPFDFPNFTQVIQLPGLFSEIDAMFYRPFLGLPWNLYALLAVVWVAGALLAFLRLVWKLSSLAPWLSHLEKDGVSSQLKRAVRRVSRRMEVKHIRVYQSSRVSVPMILFGLRPTILLPDIVYTDRELDYVLAHELTHWKNHDLWVKLLLQLCCVILWWNPLVYILRRDLDQTLELKCDFTVTSSLSERQRVEYLETILKTMRCAPKRGPAPVPAAVAEFTTDNGKRMKQRFHFVLNYQPDKRQRLLSLLLSLVTAAAVVFSFGFVAQPHHPVPETAYWENGATGEISPENAYMVKSPEGDYLLIVQGKELPKRFTHKSAQILLQSGFEVRDAAADA